MKPYYNHANITIYHGDCRDILPTLEPVDLVLTDPPYGCKNNCDYTRFSGGLNPSRNFNGKNRESGAFLGIAGDDKPFDPAPFLSYPQVIIWGFQFFADKVPQGTVLVWNKKRENQFGVFLSDGELAWQKGGQGVYIVPIHWHGMDRGGAERGDKTLHPSQKPVALMRWCIERQNNPPESILDPFMGSGTTLVAAKSLGRRCIGVEIEEKYCEIAAQRLQQEVLPL
jgi:DNA modification methylase